MHSDAPDAFQNNGCDAEKNQPDQHEVKEATSSRIRLENDFVQTLTPAGSGTFRSCDSFGRLLLHRSFIAYLSHACRVVEGNNVRTRIFSLDLGGARAKNGHHSRE